VWKGKDEVKRHALKNSVQNGGLKMPDNGSKMAAQRRLCLKKYLDLYPASWKFFLDYYLKNVGGKFLFQCNLTMQSYQYTFLNFKNNVSEPGLHLTKTTCVLWKM